MHHACIYPPGYHARSLSYFYILKTHYSVCAFTIPRQCEQSVLNMGGNLAATFLSTYLHEKKKKNN